MDRIYDIKTGYIISVHCPLIWHKPSRWLSAIIRWFTKSYWQHTASTIVINNQLMVIEADPQIRPIPWSKFVKDKIIKISAPNFEIDEKKLSEILLSRTGDEYDYAGTLIHQAIYQLCGVWLGHTNEFAERKLYCSEYISWSYNKIMPSIFPNFYKLSPKDLAEDVRFIDLYKGKANKLYPLNSLAKKIDLIIL